MSSARVALATAGLVVGADQLSKDVVVRSLALGEHVELPLGLELTHTTNSGVAFGLLANSDGALVIAITVVALVALMLWVALEPARRGLGPAAGLLAGGALGNLADRIRTDAVVDFIDFPLWPAFNLADVAITAGIAILLLSTVGREDRAAAGDAGSRRAR